MKKFLGIICLVYSFIIIYVWLNGSLSLYIAPNMQIYIKASIVPLTIMGLVILIDNNLHYRFKKTDFVLFLPLLLIFFVGDGNLSINMAKVKATTKNLPREIKEIDNIENNTEYEKKDVIDDFYFDIKDSNYSYLADYLTYMSGSRKYIGKTIRVKGFAVDYSEYLTSDYFALGRYMISCCAADAEFTGFMIKYPSNKIKYGNWYEIEGYLEIGKDSEGYDVMTINPVSVKETTKEDNQYVYNCNSYGQSACDELLKYNLEY